jgi:hypothetical protein
MTRTEYMVRAALDDLPASVRIEDRLTGIERRLVRVERLALGVDDGT